jgi:hypothetical protein
MEKKKSIMGPVISVFVMVLVVAILAGLTFLFISSLKTNVIEQTIETATVVGEVAFINTTTYTLDKADTLEFRNPAIIAAYNRTSGALIGSGNYSLSSLGVLTNASATSWNNVSLNYTYQYINQATAYEAVNGTETAGATVIGYLPLIFLALIFGAILTLVLKIILPYINLGNQMNGF